MYCDFCSFTAEPSTIAAYCAALQSEIRRAGGVYAGAEVSTVYIGGGTPSVVPAKLMNGVLDALRGSFHISPSAEITSEANPGTLTPEWLDAVAQCGVNRLSLGMQASQPELLKTLGRIHAHADTRAAATLARSHGIANLNLDLMYALPGQSAGDYVDAIDEAVALAPEHISAYSLILEPGTPLYNAVSRGELSAPDDDIAADMCEAGAARLEQYGYKRYEISNYAREGRECRHNMGYWHGAYYLGLGLNAHGMLPPNETERSAGAKYARVYNTDALCDYIARSGYAQAGRQPISAAEAMFETMMLGLRTTRGVSGDEFLTRHGVGMYERYGDAIASLAADGLGERADGGFRLTPRGLMVQNAVLMRFMDE